VFVRACCVYFFIVLAQEEKKAKGGNQESQLIVGRGWIVAVTKTFDQYLVQSTLINFPLYENLKKLELLELQLDF